MNNFTSFAGFSWISHWLIERRKVSLDYFDNLQYNYLHIVTIECQGPGKIYAPAEETHTGRGQLPSRTAFFTIGTVEGVANDERSWNGLSLCWTSPLAFVNFCCHFGSGMVQRFLGLQKTKSLGVFEALAKDWFGTPQNHEGDCGAQDPSHSDVSFVECLLSVYWAVNDLFFILLTVWRVSIQETFLADLLMWCQTWFRIFLLE